MSEVQRPLRQAAEPAAVEHFACTVRVGYRNASWVSPRGTLDRVSLPQFTQTLDAELERALLVIVDLRQLTFIDTVGVNAILAADARARAATRRLAFIRGVGLVASVFDGAGIANRLAVVDITSAVGTSGSGDARGTDGER